MDDSVFPFLSLPAELRDEIYHYSVGDYNEVAAVLYHANEKIQELENDITQSSETSRDQMLSTLHKGMRSSLPHPPTPNVLLINKQITAASTRSFEEAGSHHRRQRGTGLLPDGRRGLQGQPSCARRDSSENDPSGSENIVPDWPSHKRLAYPEEVEDVLDRVAAAPVR
ncbi:hypothetical protein LTS18_012087 [Coniosporium uncinatum]|uniref:Uncharacterized protein n=1 Tax=Coniosporium uncinatum TaxID=93489 RepID=A0ACC3DJP0_9PEZI|nr:hypothetical protein LTS18_012087 [Coniosporium uncinatum]